MRLNLKVTKVVNLVEEISRSPVVWLWPGY
jgi:hypothetical protein